MNYQVLLIELKQEVVNVLNSKGKKSVSDFHSQINKYSHLSRGAKLYAEEAVADLEHANAVSQCLINTTTASGSEDAFVTPESALSGESSVCTHLKPSPVAPGVVPEKVECSELKTIATLDTCPKEGECQWVPLMKNNEESTMENSLGIMQINKEQQSPEVLSEDRLSKSKLSDSSKDGVTRSVSSRSLNYKNPQSSYKKNTEKFTLLKPPVVPIPHKKCFLHFAVNDEPIGRIVIMLDVQ